MRSKKSGRPARKRQKTAPALRSRRGAVPAGRKGPRTATRPISAAVRSINVGALARVEGEGALDVRLKGSTVLSAKLTIYEPPRFFEAFLRKRSYAEVPDITARICGICPVAYQMSSVHALEQIFGVTVDGSLRELRRLLYCGEWIESHVLHAAMLHLPDFLGLPDAIALTKTKPDLVRTALRLKKTGNDIVALLGGREIHPINVRVGGFYRVPTAQELAPLHEELLWARSAALALVRTVSKLKFPALERDYEFVALRHQWEYPFNEGRLVSNRGLDIAVRDYEHHFIEEHVEHSNALHSRLKTRGAYFVGPLARFNLNFDRLPAVVQDAAKEAGCMPPVRNPFRSIIVRALETLFAVEEAIRIIEHYTVPPEPFVSPTIREGTGTGCTEAPRGILYHRYTVDHEGLVTSAKIVPPTAQNLPTIEADLAAFVEAHHRLPTDQLTWQCEQAIRNYDPCISCATHFLTLRLART